jgi:hypothetical protein
MAPGASGGKTVLGGGATGAGDLRLELTCDAGHLSNPDRWIIVFKAGKTQRLELACPGRSYEKGQGTSTDRCKLQTVTMTGLIHT